MKGDRILKGIWLRYLNKEQFWDALRITFNWVIPKLPFECAGVKQIQCATCHIMQKRRFCNV